MAECPGPVPLNRSLEEELDRAEGNGGGRSGDLLDVREVQEVLPQLLLGDLVGGLVIVLRELTNGPDVALLGVRGKPVKLHILAHALTKGGHDISFPGAWKRRPGKDGSLRRFASAR